MQELNDGAWLVSCSGYDGGLPLPTMDAALAVADAFMAGSGMARLRVSWADGRVVELDGEGPEEEFVADVEEAAHGC